MTSGLKSLGRGCAAAAPFVTIARIYPGLSKAISICVKLQIFTQGASRYEQ